VVGHAAAATAIAVGAVPFYDPNNIEPFSSVGNTTIYFDPAGNSLVTPEVRLKPDVVAPDNVNTTFLARILTFLRIPTPTPILRAHLPLLLTLRALQP
jgi:hypothetical protein